MSEIPRQYDADKQPEDNERAIDHKFSIEETVVINRTLRLLTMHAMTKSDMALSLEDAAAVIGVVARGQERQLRVSKTLEELKQLASLLRRVSIETENTEELTADMVAADIDTTVAMYELGGTFDDVTIEDFLNR